MGLLSAGVLLLAASAGVDEAAWVAALVAERCAPCHSPAHPEAARAPRALRKWSGAGDLAAVVATVVQPGAAADSDLYLSVELDEMPPADAPYAPLSADEKARLAAWIDAGAPLPVAEQPAPEQPGAEQPALGPEPAAEAPAAGGAAARSAGTPSRLELAGRLHPLAVHFPIALLLAALPAALLARLRRSAALQVTSDYCLALGAAGAVAAAALGWAAHEAGAGALQPELLERHEWSGFAAAGVALAALWAARAARRGRPFGRFHLPLVAAAAAIVSLAGHFGGQLVWGADFLDFLPLPF